MMLEQYTDNLGTQLYKVIDVVLTFLPSFVLAIVTVLLGWILGIILGRAVAHIFDILKIDQMFNKLGLIHLSQRSGYNLTLGNAFGGLVKWSVILAFFLAATNILGLDYLSTFLLTIMGYLPNVFVAGIILIITSIFAPLVENMIDGSSRSVGNKTGFAGTVAKYAIVVTGILAALSQLNIADVFADTLFTGIIVALALAFGLAFGLGGKAAAERAIGKIEDDFTKK